MDEIQRVLIAQGRKDLAQKYFQKLTSITIPKDTPSWAKPEGKQVDKSKIPEFILTALSKMGIKDYLAFLKGKDSWRIVFKSNEISKDMARVLRKIDEFAGSGTVNYNAQLMFVWFEGSRAGKNSAKTEKKAGTYEDILVSDGHAIDDLIKNVRNFIKKLNDEKGDIEEKIKEIGWQRIFEKHDDWGKWVDEIVGSLNEHDRRLDRREIVKKLIELQNDGYEPHANLSYMNTDLENILRKL